ncbi:CBS domain-containing protein [Microbulbifer bruguierae]|uniref:CBS domain-containing protein n=1 Tax=Microbulbifer bruguierae TaxID=3029061 RepID=A0ABY8NB31_9GAMM|nr:CBS domain-containing protein [Microbulbifer bruguierae]WGL16136.1 CBS domain-containing protein [Microbulbifer bruguierae]
MKVEQAMHRGVTWCAPDTPLTEVAKLLRDHDVGAIPVGKNDRLIGMVTDRDIVCRAIAEGQDLKNLCARDVMTEDIEYCYADENMEQAIEHMELMQIRRMPVIDGARRMIGMLSMGDISHSMNDESCHRYAAAVSAHH